MKLRAAAAALMLLAAGVAFPVAPAAAGGRPGTAGYCPDARGVTVIIDFQDLGGLTIVRCAPGRQQTGLAALQHAGIRLTGTNRWGLGFVCRIEGRPGPESEPCIDTPPATAYWSYWHSPNGGKWHYSDWGVKNRTPPQGSFEGWSFSHNRSASTNPAPRLKPVRPVVKQDPPRERENGGQSTSPSPSASRTPSPSGSATPTPTSTPTGSQSPEPLPGPTDTPVEAPGWTGGDDPKLPVAAESHEDGVPMGTAFGIGLLLALVICAGYGVWARWRARDD